MRLAAAHSQSKSRRHVRSFVTGCTLFFHFRTGAGRVSSVPNGPADRSRLPASDEKGSRKTSSMMRLGGGFFAAGNARLSSLQYEIDLLRREQYRQYHSLAADRRKAMRMANSDRIRWGTWVAMAYDAIASQIFPNNTLSKYVRRIKAN